MGCLQLEDFNVNGTIATVDIRMPAQGDGDTWLLRSGSSRNQKRENSKDCCGRKMHGVKVKSRRAMQKSEIKLNKVK
jgi:hypothetical protein